MNNEREYVMLSGTVPVDHHQFVIGSPNAETYEPVQTGSVIEVGPNFCTIMTGVAYGPVSLHIETLYEPPSEPAAHSEWEVIEEATIEVTESFRVVTLDGTTASEFPALSISKGLNTFRVSALGRDSNWDLTVTEPTESYRVQIWRVPRPAGMRRLHKTDLAWNDAIVTHKRRNFWDPDPVADATLYIKYGYEQMATWAKQEAIDWGGRPPTDKLRHIAYAKQFAVHDRMLVDALVRCRAPKLRKIAAWAARHAYTIAGIESIDWIRDGLEALENGTELPFPFDERHSLRVSEAFEADPRIELWSTDDKGERTPTAALGAMNALTDASWEVPLTAVFNVLWRTANTDGRNIPKLIAALRNEFFPKLAAADRYERWIGHSVDDVIHPSGT